MCRKVCYVVELCASSPLSLALGVSVEVRRATNHRTSLTGNAEV